MDNNNREKEMNLKDIDKIYDSIRNVMSVKERISYCAQLIYRTHTHLTRHGNHLTKVTKQRSLLVLQHARQELDYLIQSKSAYNLKNKKP
jgi:hypothetical protein